VLLAIVLGLPLFSSAAAADGTTVMGRVLNGETQRYLYNARVVIEGSSLETFTDDFGEYRFAGCTSGNLTLVAHYSGLVPQRVNVTVQEGKAQRQDFTLTGGKSDQVVKLQEFVVHGQSQETAQNIAINEQRFAPNIKNVIATDAFGDIAANGVGEILKYVPGIDAIYGDNNINGLSMRGMPSAQTAIAIDGGTINLANPGASSGRSINLQAVSLNNVSRIEIDKGILPDQRADSIGGTINLIQRTAFELTKPEIQYKAYLNLNSHSANIFKRTPGGQEGGDGDTYKWYPNFEINYTNPVSKQFGFTVSAARNDQWTDIRHLAATYGTAGSTPSAPYLQTLLLVNRPAWEKRMSVGPKLDWRLSPRDVVSFSHNLAYFNSYWGNRNFTYAAGALAAAPASGIRTPATGDFSPTFTQGRTAAGTVTVAATQASISTINNMGQLSYRHTGTDWDLVARIGGGRSKWVQRPLSDHNLGSAQANLTRATLRFDDIDHGVPATISILNSAGGPVNPFVLNEYETYDPSGVTLTNQYAKAIARNADISARRKFGTQVFTGAMKAGVSYRSDTRDRTTSTLSLLYLGPDGRANSGDENPRALPANSLVNVPYSTVTMIRGRPSPQWPSTVKAYDLYLQHPSYWDATTNLGNSYRTDAGNTQELSENVAAGYLMTEVVAWKGRLRAVGGVRYERTEDRARGVLTNNSLQYRRDASGKVVLDASQRPIPLTTDALEVAKLINVPLANKYAQSYGSYFPSMVATWSARENLLVRVNYAQTLGRPDYSNLIPTVTIADVINPGQNASGAALGTIQAKNPNLKPWYADNYDCGIEYYGTAGGVLSLTLFRRDVRNFFSNTSVVATSALLQDLNLPQEYLNYQVNYPGNVEGVVRFTGLEAAVRQPVWRHVSVFGNVSLNHQQGSEQADLRSFVRKKFVAGVDASWKRLSATIKYYYTGITKVTTNAIAPDGYTYQMPTGRVDANLSYAITRGLGIFVAGRNVLNVHDKRQAYGAVTPSYARFAFVDEGEYGVLFQVGVRGKY